MVGSISAQLALFAFAVTIFAGIASGNSSVTVLTRALVAMVTAMLLGQVVGAISKAVLRDHLIRRKNEIDVAHARALANMEREIEEAREAQEAQEAREAA